MSIARISYPLVDDILLSANELSFSIDKFLKYARHVLREQKKWEPFYKKWQKWAPHASLIKFHTQENNPTETTINIDEIIDLLCELLWSDIFETDKSRYKEVYELYTQLIPFWDKVYRPNHKIARRRAIEVLSWNSNTNISKTISQTRTSLWIEINEVLELFDNFWSLLQDVSQNPSVIYISWYDDSIKPQYSEKIQKLIDFLDFWEKVRYSQALKDIWNELWEVICFVS